MVKSEQCPEPGGDIYREWKSGVRQLCMGAESGRRRDWKNALQRGVRNQANNRGDSPAARVCRETFSGRIDVAILARP